jgi:hypothetical protein
MQMADHWSLSPGDSIRRTDLHLQYGGGRQGGISPSRASPNVLVFTDPASGLKHGYVDRWDGEVFHYTGEGQTGDQRMISGNKAVLQHLSDGRALRVFKGVGGIIKYVGQFKLDGTHPWYTTDAPETKTEAIRTVIVFRLRPQAEALVAMLPTQDVDALAGVQEVEIAESNTEKAWVDPDRKPYEAELLETKLVLSFKAWIEAQGHKALRLRIVPSGEAKPLFNDVWVPALNLLVEAKGTCTREAIRMAAGQLFDYGRFRPSACRAILLPSRPRPDLVDLIAGVGLTLICPVEGKFHIQSPGTTASIGFEHGLVAAAK